MRTRTGQASIARAKEGVLRPQSALEMEREGLIHLFTVKHTGTHFALETFRDMGLIQMSVSLLNGELQGNPGDFVQLHICEKEHSPFIYDMVGCGIKCVVTLRNPSHVYRTWHHRYSIGRSKVNPKSWDVSIEKLVLEAFEEWQHVHDWFDPFVFRVDAHDRQREVENLADYLDVDYEYRFIDHTKIAGTKNSLEVETPESIRKLSIRHGY